LSLLAFDRPFLFADLTGVLSYFGMNILRGQAFANNRGMILDIIEFEDELQSFKLNKSEIENFRLTLQRVLRGEESLSQLLQQRESSILFQRKHKGSVATFINFDDRSSERYTIVEIVTRDRYGLLSTIARTLAQNACNIEVALISTEGNRAIDVFYLTKGGCKLDQSAEESLSSAMISTLDAPLF
jgi:[protein-PII] uridylyltransferase